MSRQLSFEEALTLAIRVRESLGERFDELADHLEQSRAHEPAGMLRDAGARQRETSASLRETARGHLGHDSTHDFELPDYSAIRPHMTAKQALYVAIESEQAVREWFGVLADQASDAGASRLLGDLRDEAGDWCARLQQDLDTLPGEPVDPAVFADEPVAR